VCSAQLLLPLSKPIFFLPSDLLQEEDQNQYLLPLSSQKDILLLNLQSHNSLSLSRPPLKKNQETQTKKKTHNAHTINHKIQEPWKFAQKKT
jgi:hypothetical protein